MSSGPFAVDRPDASDACSVCGGFFLLRQDGTIRIHSAGRNASSACRGSRKPPGLHVHRCSCGCTWDEEVYG